MHTFISHSPLNPPGCNSFPHGCGLPPQLGLQDGPEGHIHLRHRFPQKLNEVLPQVLQRPPTYFIYLSFKKHSKIHIFYWWKNNNTEMGPQRARGLLLLGLKKPPLSNQSSIEDASQREVGVHPFPYLMDLWGMLVRLPLPSNFFLGSTATEQNPWGQVLQFRSFISYKINTNWKFLYTRYMH